MASVYILHDQTKVVCVHTATTTSMHGRPVMSLSANYYCILVCACRAGAEEGCNGCNRNIKCAVLKITSDSLTHIT